MGLDGTRSEIVSASPPLELEISKVQSIKDMPTTDDETTKPETLNLITLVPDEIRPITIIRVKVDPENISSGPLEDNESQSPKSRTFTLGSVTNNVTAVHKEISVPKFTPVFKETLVHEFNPVSKETLVHEFNPVSKETLVHEFNPVSKETLVHEFNPVSKETLVHEFNPVSKETLVHEFIPIPKETLKAEITSVSEETLGPEITSVSEETLGPEITSVSEETSEPEMSPINKRRKKIRTKVKTEGHTEDLVKAQLATAEALKSVAKALETMAENQKAQVAIEERRTVLFEKLTNHFCT